MVGITRSKVILAFETSATASCGYMLWNTKPKKEFLFVNSLQIHSISIFQHKQFFNKEFSSNKSSTSFYIHPFFMFPFLLSILWPEDAWHEPIVGLPQSVPGTSCSRKAVPWRHKTRNQNVILIWFVCGFILVFVWSYVCIIMCIYIHVYIYIYIGSCMVLYWFLWDGLWQKTG